MPKPLLPKQKQKEIALQRIRILFQQAEEVFPKNKVLANRYASLARKIAMKVHAQIPQELKRRINKYFYAYRKRAVNKGILTREEKVFTSCCECLNLRF